MELLLSINLNAEEPKYKSRFEKLNKRLDIIRNNFSEIYAENRIHRPYQNYFCLSLFQFLLISHNVSDITEFVKELDGIKSVTSGQRDFYIDYNLMKNMDKELLNTAISKQFYFFK